jgi:hypothetical protein
VEVFLKKGFKLHHHKRNDIMLKMFGIKSKAEKEAEERQEREEREQAQRAGMNPDPVATLSGHSICRSSDALLGATSRRATRDE